MEPLTPPDDTDLEALVIDALERLPPEFRDRLGSVAIVVEDEATPEQLASVRAHGLYGLYQGVPRTAWAADSPMRRYPSSGSSSGVGGSTQYSASAPRVAAMGLGILDALDAAHALGIVHRDIKPSNVLVEEHDGQPVPKVIDFGVAKATGQALTDKSIY